MGRQTVTTQELLTQGKQRKKQGTQRIYFKIIHKYIFEKYSNPCVSLYTTL